MIFNCIYGWDEADHAIRELLSRKQLVALLVEQFADDEGPQEAIAFEHDIAGYTDLQLMDLAVEELELDEHSAVLALPESLLVA